MDPMPGPKNKGGKLAINERRIIRVLQGCAQHQVVLKIFCLHLAPKWTQQVTFVLCVYVCV